MNPLAPRRHATKQFNELHWLNRKTTLAGSCGLPKTTTCNKRFLRRLLEEPLEELAGSCGLPKLRHATKLFQSILLEGKSREKQHSSAVQVICHFIKLTICSRETYGFRERSYWGHCKFGQLFSDSDSNGGLVSLADRIWTAQVLLRYATKEFEIGQSD